MVAKAKSPKSYFGSSEKKETKNIHQIDKQKKVLNKETYYYVNGKMAIIIWLVHPQRDALFFPLKASSTAPNLSLTPHFSKFLQSLSLLLDSVHVEAVVS